jgi:K+-sensing histidine kinase KdpD
LQKKVLVCVTAQKNSKRLIDKGREIAVDKRAQLHILNVVIGKNMFTTESETELIQLLFNYASEFGGVVHALCGEDVYEIIKSFIKEEMVTNIVVGAPPREIREKGGSFTDRIGADFPYIDIFVLDRE